MTDPRLIECAKAIAAANGPQFGYRIVDDQGRELEPWNAWERHARACILKWLDQHPTEAALIAGDDLLYDTTECAHNVYIAMCAQARKELGE